MERIKLAAFVYACPLLLDEPLVEDPRTPGITEDELAAFFAAAIAGAPTAPGDINKLFFLKQL